MKRSNKIKGIVIVIVVLLAFLIIVGIKKIKSIDNQTPVLNVKAPIIYIDGNADYDVKDNLEVSFGISGGKTTCNYKELTLGENEVVCIAKGNNGLEKSASFTIIKSSTYNKNAIFFGDSITYGFSSEPKGYSWANYIGDNYDLSNYTNAGITDYRVSTYDDKNKWLATQVENHYNDELDYDFVIMQGGINDLFYDTPLGTIADDYNLDSFDKNTFIGGLEIYLYKVVNKWPTASIGYIITYYTPHYSERGYTWSYDEYKTYYDAIKLVLKKWNISYLDLFEGSSANKTYSDLLKVTTTKYLPDKLHLNTAGYNVISPYIYDWMQTLEKYSEN